MVFVQEVMTRGFVSVSENSAPEQVFEALKESRARGVVVVDSSAEKKVVGTITPQDLLLPDSKMYLPTILEVLKNIPVYRGDEESFKVHFKNLVQLRAKDMMNKTPTFLSVGDSFGEAVRLFADNERLNLILIADPGTNTVAGVIDKQAVIRFYYRHSWDWSFRPSIYSGQGAPVGKEKTVPSLEAMKELKHFSLVSNLRARHWLALSILFIVIGILAAFFIIFQISIR